MLSFSLYDNPEWRVLTAHEKLIHHYLANRGYSKGFTEVSVCRMANDLNLNRKTIIAGTTTLHLHGYIRKNSTNRRKTVYEIVPAGGSDYPLPVPPEGTNKPVPLSGINTVSRTLSVPPDGTQSKTSKKKKEEWV